MHLIFLATICCISVFVHSQRIDADTKRKQEVILIGIVLFLFAALRAPTVGTDIRGYCSTYKTVANMSFSEILSFSGNLRDPVFHCFERILSFISRDPQFLLAVVGAWVAFSFSYFVYHSKGNVLITYLLFICLRIYSFTLSGLRQAMAMGFIWIAFVFLQKKKRFLYVLFVLIGFMFHASAIAFLLALPLSLINNHKIVLLATLAVTALNFLTGDRIVYFLSNLLFPERFGSYVEEAMISGTNFSTTFFLYVAMFIFVNMFLRKAKNNDPLAISRYNIVCAGMMFSFIGQGFPNMFRIAYYFICNLFPLFSETMLFSIKPHSRILVNTLIPILLIGQYVILGTSAGTENYVFFWQV